jgi:hypothetical protein
MDTRRWRVYLVSPNWELFHTQYAFFGYIIDYVYLLVDYHKHKFSATFIELIGKWRRPSGVIDGVRDSQIVRRII